MTIENKIPIKFEREDFCPNCKTERSLMLYDRYGDKINYPEILDNNYPSYFHAKKGGRIYSFMKCENCGKEYLIDWTNSDFPRPMFSRFYRNFMKNFKNTKKY